MKLSGIYYLLSVLPVWAIAAILVAMLKMIVFGRDTKEGHPYDVARSSYLGEYGLAIAILICVTILQQNGGASIPSWLQNKVFQYLSLYASVAVGALVSFYTIPSRSGRLMDIYHDVIVSPVLFFLLFILMPVIRNGTVMEKMSVLFFIVLWLWTVVFDYTHDRINQRRWIQRNRLYLH